jgi:uncharacterized glyoxalase superfamily protein PhnB
MQKITPCLWFNDNAEEAVSFYTSIFNNSKIKTVTRYGDAGAEASGRPKGTVMTVTFELDGQEFIFRDEREAQLYGSPPLPEKIKAISLEEVRRVGVAAAAREALAYASGLGTREFWIHFDADVLDDAIMPAVDYRLPDGLTWTEIEDVLSAALAHPGAVGMEITIFNPRLDTDGKVLSAFLDMLTSAFLSKGEPTLRRLSSDPA